MSYQIILITVLLFYLALNLVVGLFISKRRSSAESGKGFINNYFIGGRSMGGLVLAMTLIATFTSASSFIGGPGVAATKGLAWVYLAMIQVPTAFIILGVLGKKFAIISRKINAVTINDFFRVRYQSPAVVIFSSICLILFFMAQMVSQFIGGAVLFQAITGFHYLYGLLLFGVVVICYTTAGGFRAVVTTDTIQGVVMVIGSILLLATIVSQAGGVASLTAKLQEVTPHYADITAGGTMTKSWLLSFWVLIGIGVLGLPQTAVRGMGFADTTSLHQAIIYGTITVGFLMLVMHIAGVFAPAILDPKSLESSDYLIPEIVLRFMNPVVAGIFIAAPLAAVMSTVSSLLILSSAALVKDLYLNYLAQKGFVAAKENEKKIATFSKAATLFLGIAVILFAASPPDLIVWINLFAMGGLECAFFAPILFGLYWRGANATGALLSSISGVTGYLLIKTMGWSMGGTRAILPAILIAIIVFIVGSLLGKKTDRKTLALFFPEN